jgi:hypothetical protein
MLKETIIKIYGKPEFMGYDSHDNCIISYKQKQKIAEIVLSPIGAHSLVVHQGESSTIYNFNKFEELLNLMENKC